MPELSQPVQQDEEAVVVVITPGGLMIRLRADDVPSKPVRESLREGNDAHAARCMANHTGCRVTIERTSQTSCFETSEGKRL